MRRLLILMLAVAASACSPTVNLPETVVITDVHTGWYDAGIYEGKNKLVPSVSLKLQNVSSDVVDNVQVNAIFRRVGETQAWGEHFVRAIDSTGLSAGQTGGILVLRSNLGYTGTASRLQMLMHRQFVDAQAVRHRLHPELEREVVAVDVEREPAHRYPSARALADDLEGFDRGADIESALKRIAATLACHAAVKAHDRLPYEKMVHILDELRKTAYSTICPHGRPVMLRLTKREIDLQTLVIEGRSSKEVADMLFVSKRTVDFHLANIYDNLQVTNRVQAFRRAARLGLIPFDPQFAAAGE